MEGNKGSEPGQCRRAGTERRLCRKEPAYLPGGSIGRRSAEERTGARPCAPASRRSRPATRAIENQSTEAVPATDLAEYGFSVLRAAGDRLPDGCASLRAPAFRLRVAIWRLL